MWHEQQDGRGRDPFGPHRDAVQTGERALGRREQCRQHQRAREQQHGLGAEDLPDVAAPRVDPRAAQPAIALRSRRRPRSAQNRPRWARGTYGGTSRRTGGVDAVARGPGLGRSCHRPRSLPAADAAYGLGRLGRPPPRPSRTDVREAPHRLPRRFGLGCAHGPGEPRPQARRPQREAGDRVGPTRADIHRADLPLPAVFRS